MKSFLFQLARKLQITKKRILVLALAPVFSLGLVAVVSAPAQADSPSPTCVEYNPTGEWYNPTHTVQNNCPDRQRVKAVHGPAAPDSQCFQMPPGDTQRGARPPWADFQGMENC